VSATGTASQTVTNVLIVDDEPRIADVLSTYLRDEGFLVRIVHDGDEALRAVKREPPDLVLLDLTLPTISGIDVMRGIRADSDVPIIMITARTNDVDRVAGLELGADDYIGKPFSPREVVARVKAVLRRSAGQRTTRFVPNSRPIPPIPSSS
jgi:DNA-binding response OmpR family regulator